MRKPPKQYKNRELRNALLRALAVGGVLSVVLVAPKMLTLMPSLDRGAVGRKKLYRSIAQCLSRLERAGVVTLSGASGRREVQLTKKGEEVVDAMYAQEYRIPEPAFWDGRWRVVMFDMHEKRKRVRDRLRMLLQNAGFLRLQDSVWIYPYPCDEFVQLVRAHLSAGNGEMLSFIAEALESDKHLRAHFRLI